MGAKHVINPNQLTMFERAGDLANPDITHHGDLLEFEHPEELMDRKVYESTYDPADDGTSRTLYESIRDKGVNQPVLLTKSEDLYGTPLPEGMQSNVLWDGHHRVFAQADINPDAFVPVHWE